MKRVLATAVLVGFFIGSTVIASLAATEHQAHHPGAEQPAATATSQGMAQMPCMADPAAGAMSPMMGKMAMMEQRMAHMFFIDRADELGLSADQVNKLKRLHTEVGTEIFALRQAPFALTAGGIDPGNADPFAELPTSNLRT